MSVLQNSPCFLWYVVMRKVAEMLWQPVKAVLIFPPHVVFREQEQY